MSKRESAFSFDCFSGGSPPLKWKKLCLMATLLIVSTTEFIQCLQGNYGKRLGSDQMAPGAFYFPPSKKYLFVVNPGFS